MNIVDYFLIIILVIVVGLAGYKTIRNRKSCGCSGSGCGSCNGCH